MLVQIQSGTLSELDELLGQVEKFGFDRSNFPIQYNGHLILLLSNDAKVDNTGRLLFDISMFCTECRAESDISGKFPDDCEDQVSHMSTVKVIAFEPFLEPCES